MKRILFAMLAGTLAMTTIAVAQDSEIQRARQTSSLRPKRTEP